MSEHFKGFSLFNDVEDEALRAFNRARILVNVAEDNTLPNGCLNGKGSALIVQYFQKVAVDDRKAAYDKFNELMKASGFQITGA